MAKTILNFHFDYLTPSLSHSRHLHRPCDPSLSPFCHPRHLCQDQVSISRTFLEQQILVFLLKTRCLVAYPSNKDIYAFVMLLFIFWKCHCFRYFRFQYRLTVGGTVSRGKPALNCFLVCIYIVYYILYSMYCIFSSKLTFKY